MCEDGKNIELKILKNTTNAQWTGEIFENLSYNSTMFFNQNMILYNNMIFKIWFYLIINIITTSFPCRYRQSWLCRPVVADIVSYAYMPARAGLASYAYMPANEAANGTTWRNPYGASAPDAWQSVGLLFIIIIMMMMTKELLTSGSLLMKLWASASLAADIISSNVASGLPNRMLSSIVVANKTGSCETTPICLRSQFRFKSHTLCPSR